MSLLGLALICLAFAMALFQGCGDRYKIIGEGFGISGIGVVSNTNALVAGRYWEQFEDDCCYPGGRGDGTIYHKWGLKLVDVRNKQVYWEANIKDQGLFIATQVTDSLMALHLGARQSPVSLWLWKLRQNNPVHHQLTWTTEPTDFRQIKPWKNGLLLAQPELRSYFDEPFVLIDTARGTIQRYSPSGEDSWMLSCADVK